MGWRVFAAAAIGKSHIDAGTECQDAFAQAVVGDTLVAAVCDGAGSQPLSHVGSEALSRRVVELLAQHVQAGESLATLEEETFLYTVASVVKSVRAELEEQALAAGVEPRCYAATLVGVVADGQGGWFFHVGDGIGAAQPCDGDAEAIVSLPENGEYANETYFVTGEDWREHLHLTRIGAPVRTLALMSDGAAPFVMAKGNAGFFKPFIEPVERFLGGVSQGDGSKALAATLGDVRTHGITGDDKTLLLALWR